MEDLIIKDFETSVQNSAEAEELFGDTTDDIIAVANQHGFIEKIPILGWVVISVISSSARKYIGFLFLQADIARSK